MVTVWLCRPDRWDEAAAQAHGLPWLDATERARWRGFVFARDKHLYLTAHCLLRWALSAAAPEIAPPDWRFTADALGRPGLVGGAGPRFSLSHTRGLTAVAIADGAVGVDVEAPRAPADPALAAAAAVFAPDERAWLDRQPPARRGISTLRLWTLKEAYAKARGLGLHLPLDSFAFTPDAHRGMRHFVPPQDDGSDWHFIEAAPAGYRLAVAARHSHARIGMVEPGTWAPRCAGVVRAIRAAP